MNKGKLIFTKENGYSYERDGRTYALLEGKTIGRDLTSDICFVIETDEEGCYLDLNTWFFLAMAKDPEEILGVCDECITGEPTAEQKLIDVKKENEKLKAENEQLKKLLLQMEKKTETKDIKVTCTQFCDFRDIAEQLMFNGTEDEGERFGVYGKNVTVHWNGMYCDCYDGAVPSNYIFPAIREAVEDGELEEE